MRYVAAYLLAVLGGKTSPSQNDIEKILSSVGIETDADKLKKVIGELNGKSIDELISKGMYGYNLYGTILHFKVYVMSSARAKFNIIVCLPGREKLSSMPVGGAAAAGAAAAPASAAAPVEEKKGTSVCAFVTSLSPTNLCFSQVFYYCLC